MNRIHKSIFNEQTGTYVAVSENTKTKGKKGNKVLAATALSVALGLGAMGSAQAQLVSACAGVSLPPSVVTEIVGDVLVPVVGPLENVLNGLLGILVPDVDLGLDDALANAAAGKPIKLDVLTGFLDANGDPTVIGENDDCNLTADSLNLTKPAGIAIGGNTITGLGSGAAGAAAVSSAADFTSIAFGNYSQATQSKAIAFGEAAQATGVGSLALGADAKSSELNTTSLGTNARANAANSVALGAGSVAIQADTISVGRAAGTDGVSDPGLTRRITNLAEGITLTDAVNLGQLNDAITNINTNGLVRQPNPSDNITVGQETQGVAVDFSGSTTTPSGVEAYDRKLIGVAAGDITKADSNEAVTGGQLYTTNKYIADALGGGAAVNADGTVSAPSYAVDATLPAFDNVGGALGNLAGRVATNETSITNIEGDITSIINGEAGIVKQDAGTRNITVGGETDGTVVDIAGTDGVRTLTGLKDGELSATSTDAVTGKQLNATNQSIATLSDNAVQYDGADKSTVTLGGTTGTTLDNVKAGTVSASSMQAINGSQLYRSTSDLAAALGGNAVVDADGNLTNVGYDFIAGTQNSVGDALLNLDTRVDSNTTNITNLMNGTSGLVQQANGTAPITVGVATGGTIVNFTGTAGVRKLTGIANGNVAAGSSEAVTGDQLNTTNLAVADALTALGGGASIDVNGVVTGPVYNIGGATFNNVGGALTNLDDRVTSNTNRITTIEGDITNIKGDITNLDGRVTTIEGDITEIKNGTAGIVKFDSAADKITVGSEVAGSSVDFTGTAGVRKLTGIADGELSATSSDAVTGKQLHATNQQVKASSQFTASALGGGAEAKDDGTFVNPLYALQEIQQDGSKKTVTFDNVGGALTSLNTSVASLQDQVNNNTSIGLVRQDSTTRVISVGGNTDGTEVNFANSNGEARVISGVAAGKGPTDAVNVQQAQEMIAGATNSLKGDIRRAEKRADAGTAAATAVATLGQAYQPGQSAFSMGGGTWRGEAGYAVGLSTVSENGKWLLKGAVSGSGRGGAGGGASVTYLW
ncbi:ESPR-type extended signal peptide-containing protein [Advenella alkanexedens]|uniref:ESPR-type extended signal peptide-containing protein n=1 Tax=Advenella alkanexedens TaxID=1481665 RepID=UPI002675C427|nr:ESPR-type extended signal peptide-containing protein [Advenella alkanexedens]WKU20473.1 ESPR-type extended signal peptide-containing protein [Advenella alkanexedens]